MNNTLTVETETDVSYLDMSINDLPYQERHRITAELATEQVKRKVSQQVMLDSLFDSDTGESHEHSNELLDLIRNEYQVNMVEVSSGNGQAHNVFNRDTGEYDIYLSADGRESGEHGHNGLADSLVDSYEGIISKNVTDIPAYEMLTDDKGDLILNNHGNYERTDDVSNMVEIENSNYSIWDTIEQKGMLIVRHSGHWKGAGCRFDSLNYVKREARRMLKKHNKLLGFNADRNGSHTTLREVEVKRLNVDKKGNRQLTKLAREARRGAQHAIDSLARVGYNYF